MDTQLHKNLGASAANTAAASLTDSQLYSLCKQYGGNARAWMRKFAGLLPEVYRRKLYKRRGFGSIHEFAAKLAGMNEMTTDRILRLAEKLEDKPILLGKFESGSGSWSKLETVAYIATPATEKEFAEKIDTLPRLALIEYVKDYRLKVTACDISNSQTQIQQVWGSLTFPVSPEVEQKLRLFKQKFEKKKKQTLTWNEVMLEMTKLLETKEEIAHSAPRARQQKIIQICPDCIKKRENEKENYGVTLRAIPTDVQKIIDARGNALSAGSDVLGVHTCEFPNCLRPAEIYHHTRRYSLRQNHDPNFIRALCKPHEQLAHAGLIQNEEKPPADWRIGERPNYDAGYGTQKFKIDEKVNVWRTAEREKGA